MNSSNYTADKTHQVLVWENILRGFARGCLFPLRNIRCHLCRYTRTDRPDVPEFGTPELRHYGSAHVVFLDRDSDAARN